MLRNRSVVAHFQQFVVGYQKQCVVQHCCSAFGALRSGLLLKRVHCVFASCCHTAFMLSLRLQRRVARCSGEVSAQTAALLAELFEHTQSFVLVVKRIGLLHSSSSNTETARVSLCVRVRACV